MKITHEDILEISRSVQKPDNTYDLRDVEKELVASFSVTAAEAKRLVRAWDRANTLSPQQIARFWEKLADIAEAKSPKTH